MNPKALGVGLEALFMIGLAKHKRGTVDSLIDDIVDVPEVRSEVEPLLVQLFHDKDEYVSRRTLLALARRRSKVAEPLALQAWSTEHEYQRMAALDVLFVLNSPLLSSYLDLAQRDGREHIVNFSNQLRSKISNGNQ